MVDRARACLGLAVLGVVALGGCFIDFGDEPTRRARPEPIGPAPDVVAPVDRAPPPPISGGTLLVLSDDATAVAADSDRDRVWVANLVDRTLTHEIGLEMG